jgi:hypothetical protein
VAIRAIQMIAASIAVTLPTTAGAPKRSDAMTHKAATPEKAECHWVLHLVARSRYLLCR